MKTIPLTLRAAAFFAALSCIPQLAHAATYYWDTTTTSLWATGANWSNDAVSGGTTGTVTTSADTAVFNQSSLNGNEIVQFGADAAVDGIIFSNTGTTSLQSNSSTSRTLTLGVNGITVDSAAGAVTIGDATNILDVAFSQPSTTFTLNGSNSLTFVNSVTQTASGSNVSTTVNGAGNTLTLGAYNLGNAGTGKNVTIKGSADVQINGTVADNSTTASNLIYGGTGTLTLSGNNTYTGTTTISGGGTVSIGGVSGLGNATSAVIFSTGTGGKLSYTGNSATFTRGFSLSNASTVGQIDTTTAGQTLTIATGNITFSSSSQTLIIGGAGNTTISSSITGAGKLTKQDAGTLLLSGTNTYTGATTINAGTLALGATNALATGTAITLGGGTLNLGGFNPAAAFTTTLTMTSGSTIDFGSHVAGITLKFANSSAATWTGTLALLNFTVGTDTLSFTSISGLTVDQLSQISLAGYTATGINSSGNVQFTAIPEPSTYVLIFGSLAIGMTLVVRRRRG
ncbi:MAG: autotransporter-associated beta strand repeat-containing protein [Opitutaceae bacterium]|jgi:autotransporter-associated beta strand protein